MFNTTDTNSRILFAAHSLAGAIALGALLALPGNALADDDEHEQNGALVEELILGESPHAQEEGETQITISAEHLSADEENTTDLVAEFEYGITDTIQVGVEVPYRFIDGKDGEADEDGLRDVAVSLLWNFLNDDGLVLSAMGEAGFTNGDEDKELGEENAEYEAMLLAAMRIGEAELYGGAGGEFTDDDEVFVYSAGLAVPIGQAVGLLEVSATDGSETEEDEAYFAPGVVVEVMDDVEALIGVPIGLNDDSADWGLTFRLTVEF